MGSVDEKSKIVLGGGGGALAGSGSQTSSLLEEMKLLKEMQDHSGTRKTINSELWHACAGPLVYLPQVGSLVHYFPQGHSEQVSASTKRIATSQIPNCPSYPNLPSQMLCQVHSVTLHADKDTDEIFAQMCLQPVNSEKDVFPIPDFGLKPSKHPTEFFCKTLTASDTSTHGGFSVPRRAAEKLFPQLDYTMQPPTQELVVKDLHDNTWTFRHIYRGQPKRHLLTTGWSVFVGAKRLKAGDSVLFIRDEKSQLLVGVRRANRQQATLPSSVLSADSMHIGVLAAAAHAAANRSKFTIFYNPRACPSEFVIPLAKYRKAIYGTQISVGMRFGMMLETEDSGKRRYMGTIVGISDLDPLRWPGSKWRNLQVEWDEPGCGDKLNRVSSWEIETPESLFIFPSLTSGLKRPFHPGLLGVESTWSNMVRRPYLLAPGNRNADLPFSTIPYLHSDQSVDILLKSQLLNQSGVLPPSSLQVSAAKGEPLHEVQIPYTTMNHKLQHMKSVPQSSNHSQFVSNASETVNSITFSGGDLQGKPELKKMPDYQAPGRINTLNSEGVREVSMDRSSQLTLEGETIGNKLIATPGDPQNLANHLTILDQNITLSQMQSGVCPVQPQLDYSTFQPQQISLPQSDSISQNGFVPLVDTDEWPSYPSNFQSVTGVQPPGPFSMFGQDQSVVFPEAISQPLSSMCQEMWDHQWNSSKNLSQVVQLPPAPQLDSSSLNYISDSSTFKDLANESNNQGGIYSCLNIDNAGNSLFDPSVSNTIVDEFCNLKDVTIQNPSNCLVGSFCSSQDVQSQITSASLTESQAFSRPDYPDNSGGTSSSNVDFDEGGLLHNSSWQQVAPPKRTYTKVQKSGSVGRSIDVTCFSNYEELLSAIERMFGLEGLLNDPRSSGWKLVYVDYENDVLLVGDDPWEEFVGCVRCIRILSPAEVQQMSEEGMKLLNSTAMQDMNGSLQTGAQT